MDIYKYNNIARYSFKKEIFYPACVIFSECIKSKLNGRHRIFLFPILTASVRCAMFLHCRTKIFFVF